MKKLFSLMIIVLLLPTLLSISIAADNPPTAVSKSDASLFFNDLAASHWAYIYIATLNEKGIVSGYPDSSFKPERTVTRAEFAKIAVLAMNWNLTTPDEPFFKDTPKSFWAYKFIETAKANGVISGFPDGTFRPNNNITRAEIAAIITRAKNYPVITSGTGFKDVASNYWARNYILTIKERGIISGYQDGTFRPTNPATRAEAVKMVYGILGVKLPKDETKLMPRTEVKESTINRFQATLSIPGLAGNPITVGDTTYHQLRLMQAGYTSEEGKPEVPFIVKYFALPKSQTTGKAPTPLVKITPAQTRTIKDIVIYPAQPPILDQPIQNVDTTTPPFSIDEKTYTSESSYPAKLFETEQAFIGSLPVLIVRIYPVRYFPAQKELQFYQQIDIDIDFNPQKETLDPPQYFSETDEAGNPTLISGPLVIGLLSNQDTVEEIQMYGPVVTGTLAQIFDDPMYHLLIITDPAFYTAAERLTQHKKDLRTWRVKLVSTTEIQAGYSVLTSSLLRQYIQEEWRSNGLLRYVTDGDEATVPQERDFYTAQIYMKRRGTTLYLGLNIFFRDGPLSETIHAYIDTDGDSQADVDVSCWPPSGLFEVKAPSTPGSSLFDRLLYSGRVTIRRDSISLEFPWDSALAGQDTADMWFVVGLGETSDRMPNNGLIQIDRHNYQPFLRHLILIGDAEYLPVNYDLTLNESLSTPEPDKPVLKVGTDYYYADIEADRYPEISVGRLPVDTLEQADQIVNKIIQYETTRPDDRFLRSVAVLGQFQDDPGAADTSIRISNQVIWASGSDRIRGASNLRSEIESLNLEHGWQERYLKIKNDEGRGLTGWLRIVRIVSDNEIQVSITNTGSDISGQAIVGTFDGKAERPFIDTTERVRDYFISRGYTITRTYGADSRTSPLKFSDGRSLPASLQRPTFGWDATTNDVINVFSSYQNHLILHRDHGGIDGWGTPGFRVGSVTRIANPTIPLNGIYPLVFSINCSSAYFDNETDIKLRADGSTELNNKDWSEIADVNFSEALLRHQGGAIAVIAPTRLSMSGLNDIFTDGLIQALYPDYLNPGSRSASVSVLGDILNYAKFYACPRFGSNRARYYLEIFHAIGDPSLPIWHLP